MSYDSLTLTKDGLKVVERDKAPNERYVEMKYSGICGTDKHAIHGEEDLELPRVLGHENVGVLNGKRVTWPAIMPCGDCTNCERGMKNICEENQVYGLTCDDENMGGWGEEAPIGENTVIYEIPQSIPDDVAVLIESMASTKSLRQVDLSDKALLIIGSGPIGLLSAVHAHHAGAKKIGMTGHHEQYELLESIVDDFYVKNAPVESHNRKYDVVMDAGGSPSSLRYSVESIKPQGIILESACMAKGFEFNVSKLVKKEAKMFTQLGYTPEDFPWAIDIVKNNVDLLRNVITHKLNVEDYDEAKKVIENEHHGKIMFDLR